MAGVHGIVNTRNSLSAASVALVGGLGLLLLLPEGVEAAYGNGVHTVQKMRQDLWRPNPQAPRANSAYRWRPLTQDSRVQGSEHRRLLPQTHQRWARSARPLNRGGELASQFRPDQRFDEPVRQPEVVLDPGSEQHAQFRPINPPARRRTYEELFPQQEPVTRQPQAPAMPYPALPPPTMPYLPPAMPGAPYWPYW